MFTNLLSPIRLNSFLDLLSSNLAVDLFLRMTLMSLVHILEILVGMTISIMVINQSYLVGGRFFHAISKNVKGMAINPVAIRIGSITAGSSDLPIARKYGNG
jgi:hypothetical protein